MEQFFLSKAIVPALFIFFRYIVKISMSFGVVNFGNAGFWRLKAPETSISLGFRAVNVVNAGFWRLKAPETSIWAPEAAFGPNFAYFLVFFGPGPGSRGFSRPWHRISRQKCRIWMRMCRDMTIFVVFEKLNFQAVIKSAASAASLGTKSRKPRSRGVPRSVVRPSPIVRPSLSSHRAPSSGHSPGSWFP